MRRRARIDGNHPEVVKALRAAGYAVLSLAAVGNLVPDLLVARGGKMWLLEVKRAALKSGKAKQEKERERLVKQAEWAERWPAPVHRVYSAEEAIAILEGAESDGK